MEALKVVVPAARSAIPGVNVLMIGATGTGKTTSIKTLVAKGITPFCIFLEPEDGVIDLPRDKWHSHYIAPASANWSDMIDSAEKINQFNYDLLAKMTDINKRSYGQFVEVLKSLNNFKCDHDGKTYGDVCTWGTDRALVIDSLSGLNIMAMNLMVGSKPVKSQSDWQVAMDNLERLIQKLCTDTHCHFILTAHSERETDEVMGGSKIMVSTLGRKLAPKIPRFFSDVVLADRQGSKFTWSTAAAGADLKARNLPIADGIPPTFATIIEAWQKRGGIIESAEQPL